MDKVYYAKIASPTIGFTQQIFNLVTSIMAANEKNIKMIAVDNFYFQNSEIKEIPVSLILDLEKLNYVLSRRYGIHVYDKNFLRFELRSIFYGVPNRDKNVTQEILNAFCDENDVITIHKDISLNPIIGDPFIGVMKRLLVNYTIKYKDTEQYNSFSMDEFSGSLKDDLIIDYNVDKADYILQQIPLPEVDKSMFSFIIKNIIFTDPYLKASEEFIDFIKIKDKKVSKVNVIHLRLEEDVAEKFNKENKDNKEDYIKTLEDKYIEEIEKNINKSDDTLILSYSLNNRVLVFLKENGYTFYLKEKDLPSGREINSIIDTAMNKYCNNVFIGNFNEVDMQGSCYSYYLMNQLPANVKKINIDLFSILP